MSEEFHDQFGRLWAEVHELKGRMERMVRHGTIADAKDIDLSDPSKPRARITIGLDADGKPVKGPWVPYSTIAGARNQHNPPSVGQQLTQFSPDGDFEQAVLLPLGHSNQVKSPSTDPGTYVDQAGATDRRFKDGKDRQAVGDKSEHLIIDKAQRLKTESREKLVFKFGDQTFCLAQDALEPTDDIGDF